MKNLWPYSKIKAGVAVLNGGKAGESSDLVKFETPEGSWWGKGRSEKGGNGRKERKRGGGRGR